MNPDTVGPGLWGLRNNSGAKARRRGYFGMQGLQLAPADFYPHVLGFGMSAVPFPPLIIVPCGSPICPLVCGCLFATVALQSSRSYL